MTIIIILTLNVNWNYMNYVNVIPFINIYVCIYVYIYIYIYIYIVIEYKIKSIFSWPNFNTDIHTLDFLLSTSSGTCLWKYFIHLFCWTVHPESTNDDLWFHDDFDWHLRRVNRILYIGNRTLSYSITSSQQ